METFDLDELSSGEPPASVFPEETKDLDDLSLLIMMMAYTGHCDHLAILEMDKAVGQPNGAASAERIRTEFQRSSQTQQQMLDEDDII